MAHHTFIVHHSSQLISKMPIIGCAKHLNWKNHLSHTPPKGNQITDTSHFTKQNHSPSSSKFEAKPPSPCKYCQSVGKSEWHLHKDCPRRKRYNNDDNNSALSPSTSDQANYSSIDQCNLTSYPPEYNSQHRFIHIDDSINNTKIAALIDTASPTHLISSNFTSKLNLKP